MSLPAWLATGCAFLLCSVPQVASASEHSDPVCEKYGNKMFVQTIRLVWAIKGDIPAAHILYRLKTRDDRIITQGRTDNDGMIKIVLKRSRVPKGSVVEIPGGNLMTTVPAVSQC